MSFKLNFFAQSRRRKVLAELAAMSDAHLDDIGLTRAQVATASADSSYALRRPMCAAC
jgi:uncharacterized protein YjiS (DUF1127 family)